MVTTMTTMFNGCSSLQTLDVSNFDTSMVTNMNNMFHSCSNLTTLDVSNFDTSKVTTMTSMFRNCSGLTTLDVSKWVTSKVNNMNDMFKNCSSLTTLDISNWDTLLAANMHSMTDMFNDCSKLSTLKWTNWLKSVDLSSTKLTRESLRGLLQELGDVTEQTLTLNDTLSGYLNDSDFIYASLKGWTITPGVTSSYITIKASDDISSVNVSTSVTCLVEITNANRNSRLNDVVNAYTACDTVLLYSDDSLVDLSNFMGSTNNKVAKTKIKHIYIMKNFNTSNVTNMYGMFHTCPNLQTLDVSNLDTSKADNLGSMFYGCSGLTTLDVSNFDTSMTTKMGNMFDSCSNIQTLDVSKWDTSKVTGMNNLFGYCIKLTTLDVSKWKTSKVTNMEKMFYGCSSLTTLDVSNWDTSSVTSMFGMFNSCSNLQTLDVSKWDVSKVYSMNNMFQNCKKITEIIGIDEWYCPALAGVGSMFQNTGVTRVDASSWKRGENGEETIKDLYSFSNNEVMLYLDISGWTITATNFANFLTGSLTTLKWSNWTQTINISHLTNLTAESVSGLLANLATVTDKQTLTIGTTNIAKVTDDEIRAATRKGWTIA